MRAAIYCRISSDREDLRMGVKTQEKDCRELCIERGWEVLDPYIDNSISAADPSKQRPEYLRLVADMRRGKFDVIVVATADRLWRQPLEQEQLITDCQAAGMNQVVTLRRDTDLRDEDALSMLRIEGVFAGSETAKIRRRVRRRQLENAEQGRPSGGGKRAFGWERDGMTVRDAEATHIKEAAERVLMGETIRSIATDWNRRAVKTVTGVEWTPNSVKSTLRNMRNTGLRQHQGVLIGDAKWPEILDRETFERLQVIFNNPARYIRTPPRDYPLRGVLCCGECGHTLVSSARKKPIPGDPGRRLRYYVCRTDTGGCGKIIVTAEHAEAVVFGLLLGFVDNPRVRQLAVSEQKADDDEIRALIYENATDETTLKQLSDDHYDKVIDRATFLRKTSDFRKRIDERQSRIAELQGTSALDRFDGRIAENWDELTAEEQRTITLSLIASVRVKPGGKGPFDPKRLDIRWKYGALAAWAESWEKTATPADLEAASDEAWREGQASEDIPVEIGYRKDEDGTITRYGKRRLRSV